MSPDLLRPVLRDIADRWWLPVLRGVVAIAFGAVCFARPGIGLAALVTLWGAYAIVDGVLAVASSFRRARMGARWGWLLFEGVIGIAAGVFSFAYPGMTALVLLGVIAAWALITGGAEIATAIRLRKLIEGEWMLGLAGVLSIVFGVLLLRNPGPGALAVVWLIGAYAVVFGALLIGVGARLYRWHRVSEPMIPTGGTPTPA
jgi:uncharacterized membrane protein HdeD (DUF308 family)